MHFLGYGSAKQAIVHALVLARAADALRCSAPIVPNATRPACAEGPTIEDQGACTTRCLAGLHPSRPILLCSSGFLEPASFTCGTSCKVPDGIRTLSPPCDFAASQSRRMSANDSNNSNQSNDSNNSDLVQEIVSRTRIIRHGRPCQPVCEAGLEPFEDELICDNGKLWPNPIIHCDRFCDAPVGIDGAASVPCVEGLRIPEGGVCTPQCQADHDLVGDELICTNGTLSPSQFLCRPPFTCSLPPEDLWTRTFPTSASEDYPAEDTCFSASAVSATGKGCSRCYSPLLEVDANAPGPGLDVGIAAQLILRFKSAGGRRLLLVPKNEKDLPNLKAVWRARTVAGRSANVTTFHPVFVSDFAVPVGEADVGVAHINSIDQLDSGKVIALAESTKEVALRTPLQRPANADLLLSVSFSLFYVIAGCSVGLEGQGSASMTLAVRSLAYNDSACVSPGPESSCLLQCLPGSSGQPTASCTEDGGTFSWSGCYADCEAPEHFVAHVQKDGIQNAQAVTCAEGKVVQHGNNCTTMCVPGFTAVPPSLLCQDKRLLPSRFVCQRNCVPPSDANAYLGIPPCKELQEISILKHGSSCTPRCAAGFRPDRFEPLICNDGQLEPRSFGCNPVLVSVETLSETGVARWTAFSSAGNQYLVAAGTSSAVFHMMPGGQGQLQMSNVASYGLEAQQVLPVAVDGLNGSSILLVTALQRSLGSHGVGGLSPVYHWQGESESVSWLQDLPLAGCSALIGAAVRGQRMLVAGSSVRAPGSAGYMQSATFLWNRTNSSFVEVQRLDIAALALAVISFDGDVYVAAAADASQDHGHLSKLYRWHASGTGLEHLVPEVEFATSHVVDIAWLGCKDDAAFADASGQPCYRLALEDCQEPTVRVACAALCGCGYDVSALAVAVLDPSPHIRVFAVSSRATGRLQLDEIASAPAASPMSSLCTFFAPVRDELYVMSLAHSYVIEPRSSIFAWQSEFPGNGSLESVSNTEFLGATSCTAVQAGNISYVLTGAPGNSQQIANSEMFAIEGKFSWRAFEWEACSIDCRPVGPEISIRRREVVCTGQPSGFPYNDHVCSGEKPITEEICYVPLCSESGLHDWHRGEWGECEGYCGTGTTHRIVDCRRTDDGSVVTSAYCNEATKPRNAEDCELQFCSSFRLVNRIAVSRSWQVIELQFFVDDACTQEVRGRPFAGDFCRECRCKDASGTWGNCDAELAFDGHVPYLAPDGQLAAGTTWISECGQTQRCAARGSWIGLHLEVIESIRCVNIMQSGDQNHQAREITLEIWDTTTNTWEPITEWAGIDGGKWISMVVPQACTDLVDCRGHGTVQGLPGRCVCTCFEGYAGSNCEYCLTSYEGYPDCELRATYSDGWRLVALADTPSGTWHLADVSMYTDVLCSAAALITPESIREFSMTTFESQDEILSPERAFDAAGEKTTWISPKCTDCSEGQLWIGVFLHNISEVKCVKIMQGHQRFAVDSIALERWHGAWNDSETNGEWHRIRRWNGILQRSEDRRFTLRLVCDEGVPPSSISIQHDCRPEQLPWESCRVSCKTGYAGSPSIFICKDDFTLTGLMPVCTPKECTEGIPSAPGVTIDECMGLRTDERCQASCTGGWSGDSVNYVCSKDGTFREVRTGRSGQNLAPSCTQGIRLSPVSAGVRPCLTTGWRFSAWCAWLLALRSAAVGAYG